MRSRLYVVANGIVPFSVEISDRHSELPHGARARRSWGKKRRRVSLRVARRATKQSQDTTRRLLRFARNDRLVSY